MSVRDEVRALCTEADHWLAEEREWLAAYKARSSVTETRVAGLIYKEYDNSVPAAPAQSEYDWSGWEAWLRGHLDNERAVFTEALGEFGYELRKEWQQERDAELLKLRAEVAELKGRVDTLLSLVTKGGEIVDLPDWRKRHA